MGTTTHPAVHSQFVPYAQMKEPIAPSCLSLVSLIFTVFTAIQYTNHDVTLIILCNIHFPVLLDTTIFPFSTNIIYRLGRTVRKPKCPNTCMSSSTGQLLRTGFIYTVNFVVLSNNRNLWEKYRSI